MTLNKLNKKSSRGSGDRIVYPTNRLPQKINEIIDAIHVLENATPPSSGGITIISAKDSHVSGILTLLVSQSPAIIIFDKIDGVIVQVPPIEANLSYRFKSLLNITSNTNDIKLATGGQTYIGNLRTYDVGPNNFSNLHFAPVNANIISMDGTTTGSQIGTDIHINSGDITAKEWLVTGVNMSSGLIDNPFDVT